jgi:hypothetical protein
MIVLFGQLRTGTVHSIRVGIELATAMFAALVASSIIKRASRATLFTVPPNG